MAELVRVAALTGYFETMAGLGTDPRPLLREQGLDAALLANPELPIPARAAIRLLERSAEVSDCITLGLRMAEGRSLANLGAASLLIAHQPTLRRALQSLREFRARINSTLVLQIEEGEGETVLREDFSLRQPERSRQSSDLALGVLTRLCRSVLGESWSPQAVYFAHEPPPKRELDTVRRLFRCKALFNADFNGLAIATSDLDRDASRADDALALQARRLLEADANAPSRTIAEEVDQLVRLLLPSGRATIKVCAASLGVTVRTLQRRLAAEGEQFGDLLERARMQLATQYLGNRRMRVTDVADLLGYGSIGAFTRWHVQRFGQSPRDVRKVAAGPRSSGNGGGERG